MEVNKLLADPLPARAQDRPKQARALSWAPESHGVPFQPHGTQVYFRGLFSPVPRVLVHGPYQETDVVEAHMLDEEGQVVEKALDGTVVRLHKRWENKQFDGRIATFSRLKVLYGERGKRYRLQVTWYERSAGPGAAAGLRFSPVCSVVSERAFTVRAHIKKDQFSARSADGGAASAPAFPGGSEGAGGELEGEGEGEAEPPDDDDGPPPLPLPLPPPQQQQQQQPQTQTPTTGRSQKRRRQSAPIAPRSVPPSMVSVMSYEPTDPGLAPPQAPRLAPPPPPPPPLPPAPTLHQLFPHHQPQPQPLSQAQHPLQPGQPQAPPAHMQHLMNAEPSGGIAYHFSPATVASSSPRTPFIVHAFPSYTHLPYQPQATPPLSFEKTDGSIA